jgi:hypothetical protein
MAYIPIYKPGTTHLLARFDPDRDILEFVERRVKTVIDLKDYRMPETVFGMPIKVDASLPANTFRLVANVEAPESAKEIAMSDKKRMQVIYLGERDGKVIIGDEDGLAYAIMPDMWNDPEFQERCISKTLRVVHVGVKASMVIVPSSHDEMPCGIEDYIAEAIRQNAGAHPDIRREVVLSTWSIGGQHWRLAFDRDWALWVVGD